MCILHAQVSKGIGPAAADHAAAIVGQRSEGGAKWRRLLAEGDGGDKEVKSQHLQPRQPLHTGCYDLSECFARSIIGR